MSQLNCNNELKNLGWRECLTTLRHIKRLILVPTYKANGDVNELANDAAVTKTALQAKFDASNILDRWFPTLPLKNVTVTVEDPKTSAADDDELYFIRHGKIMFEGYIWGCSMEAIRKMAAYNFGSYQNIYAIDDAKNFVCKRDVATKLKVQPISIKSFYVTPIFPTADDVMKAKVTFEIDLADERYYVDHIEYADLDFNGLSATDVYSLEDVTIDVTSPTTGGFTISAKLTEEPDVPVTGLVLADFTLKDDAGGSETITSVTDNGDGTYTAVATIIADGYVLTTSKNRYSFNTATFTVV